MTERLKIMAAGSLRHAFPAILAAFEAETGTQVNLCLGPAGLLRERIEQGETFDLFASANMAHPVKLAAHGIADSATCFAHNRFCVIARADLGLTAATFLQVIADPVTRIGISTPADDPSGDYAFEVFDRIGKQSPGLGQSLKHRARQLVGGRHSPPPRPGAGPGFLISDGLVDLTMGYRSNAVHLMKDSKFTIIDVPAHFAPVIAYGLAVSITAGVAAADLKNFILSEKGQRILQEHGFRPAE